MKRIRIAVLDDEDTALDVLRGTAANFMNKHGFYAQIDCFKRVDQLRAALESNFYDLVFLDIAIGKTDGIAVGREIAAAYPKTDIIFVSGNEDRVFDAFSARPLAFVRKNRFFDDISSALNDYLKKNDAALESKVITFKTQSEVCSFDTERIVCIECIQKIQRIYFDTGKHVDVYSTMEKLIQKLNDCGFYRAHKGFIVNFRYIETIEGRLIRTEDGREIPVSRHKIMDVKSAYLSYLKGGGAVVY